MGIKKIIGFVLIVIFSTSCTLFCEERGSTFKLKDFERDLVSFTSNIELTYISNEEQQLIANVQDIESFENEVESDRSCNINFKEGLRYTIVFPSIDTKITFSVFADVAASQQTEVRFDSEFDFASNSITNLPNQFSKYSDENITISNVLLIDNFFSRTSNQDPLINLIAYSRERGVEYILFTNGDYLTLQP